MAKIRSTLLLPKSSTRFKFSYDLNFNFNSNFIAKHFVHSNSNPNSSSTILFNNLELDGRKKNTFSFLTYSKPNDDHSFVKFDIPSLNGFNGLKIHGHSHGLICFSSVVENHIFLCNPNTGESRQLPPSILLQPELCQRAVGFGYDLKSKDFKVLRIVQLPHTYSTCKAELYYLSTDRWREIEDFTCSAFSAMNRDIRLCERYHEGVYYWGVFYEYNIFSLLSFDMSEEVVRTIPLPWNFGEFDYFSMDKSIEVWNGLIVLIIYPSLGELKTYHVWAMEKDKYGRVSWSEICTIGPFLGMEKPLLFVNCDQLLMEAKCGYLISYNLKTKELTHLPVEAKRGYKLTIKEFRYLPVRECKNLLQSFVFEKSLLSVAKPS